MTTATNDITGDKIQTGVTTDLYRANYDLVFKKPQENKQPCNNCDRCKCNDRKGKE